MVKRLGGALGILALFWLLLPLSAGAQSSARAVLSFPDTQNFPHIETFLDVHDSDGRFVSGITDAHVRLSENGKPVEVAFVQEIRPGVQLVVAMDPNAAFIVRNSQGDSRYEMLLQTLASWGNSRRGTTIDDLSLLITGGGEQIHTTSSAAWAAALPAEAPDGLGQKANLDTLGRAIDIAGDPTPRPGMSRALLYITPLLDADANPTLQSLGVQAQQQGIQVFVWLVSAPGMESNTGAEGLIELANTSGGQFFAFSGTEGLPDLETYLRPLRSIYHLGYISQISTAGTHQLSAEIQTASGEIVSDPLNFDLSIRPPNPVFVSPQLEINRRPPDTEAQVSPTDSGFTGLLQALSQNGAAQPSLEPADYLPQAHLLQVIFDFPDQHPRPLNRTALFVDGQIVDENLSPPFDQFEWNLESYSANGLHRLRAEAEDMLGLTGSSIEIYVQVDVAQPAVDPWAAIVPHAPALAGLALVLLSAVVFLGLILSGRIRPHPFAGRRARKPRQPAPAAVAPVTIDDPSMLQNWVNRLHWPQRRITPQAQAFLVPMGGENSAEILPRPTAANLGADKPRPAHLQLPAPIAADEITLGQDPNQATLVLSDASVQGLHARLRRSANGEYVIYDENSIAGTWVNYELANPEGQPLEHGDVVHIGRLGFRFTVRNPQRTRRPVVVPMAATNGSCPEEAAP